MAGLVTTASPAASSTPSPTLAPRASASALFAFQDPRIDESSGLATSSFGDGIVYTHNDSGDVARFFAVNSSGATAAVYTLRGATNIDWEDMDAGTDAAGRPVLYLGDIGDNLVQRSEIEVYQVAEPRGPSSDVAWVRYRFVYDDGPHNAESLLVNPVTHRLYIASKVLLGEGELYEAPAVLSTTSVNVLTPVRPVPPLTTSGEFSPDGSHIVLLTYLRAYWAAGVAGTLHAFDVPLQQQDEAIAYTRDGASVLVGSEGVGSSVFRVQLPAAALDGSGAPDPESATDTAPASATAASATSTAASVAPSIAPSVAASSGARRATSVPGVRSHHHNTTATALAIGAVAVGVVLVSLFWRRRSRYRR